MGWGEEGIGRKYNLFNIRGEIIFSHCALTPYSDHGQPCSASNHSWLFSTVTEITNYLWFKDTMALKSCSNQSVVTVGNIIFDSQSDSIPVDVTFQQET